MRVLLCGHCCWVAGVLMLMCYFLLRCCWPLAVQQVDATNRIGPNIKQYFCWKSCLRKSSYIGGHLSVHNLSYCFWSERVTLAPTESAALWVVCSFNVARLAPSGLLIVSLLEHKWTAETHRCSHLCLSSVSKVSSWPLVFRFRYCLQYFR